MFGPLLEVQMSFRVAGARDCAPCQKWTRREGFVAFPKTMAGLGHLKRICTFSVAGAVQEACSSELLGGPGADFLRGVAWSSGLLRRFCVTGAALRMTWPHFFMAGRNTLDRWSWKIARCIGTRLSALQLSIFEGSLAELLRFWCRQLGKMRRSRRIVSFFDVVKFKKSRRSAAFWSLQLERQTDRQTHR